MVDTEDVDRAIEVDFVEARKSPSPCIAAEIDGSYVVDKDIVLPMVNFATNVQHGQFGVYNVGRWWCVVVVVVGNLFILRPS